VALSSESVVLRSKKDALFRSMVLPGFGQIYNRQPVKAGIFIGAEVLLIGTAVSLQLAGAQKEDEYQAYAPGPDTVDPAAEAKALREDAESLYQLRNYAIGAAAVVWIVNAADAYFSGVDGDKVVVAPAVTGDGFGLALAGRF